MPLGHSDIQALRERRIDLTNRVQEGAAELAELDALEGEERDAGAIAAKAQQLLRVEDAYDEADAVYRAQDRAARVSAAAEAAGEDDEPASAAELLHERAFLAYLQGGMPQALDVVGPEARTALQTVPGREDPRLEGIVPDSARAAAFSTPSNAVLFPPSTVRMIERIRKAYGGVEPYARRISTPDGRQLDFPVFDRASRGKGQAAVKAESADAGSADWTNLTKVSLGSYRVPSGILPVPREAVRDAVTDLESFVAEELIEDVARAEAEMLMTGPGETAPTGLVTATSGVSASHYVSRTDTGDPKTTRKWFFRWEDATALFYAIDKAYRAAPNSALVVGDGMHKALMLLHDNDNRPFWQPSSVAGEPDRFRGKLVIEDFGMPDAVPTEEGEVALGVFGDLRCFFVRRVGSMMFERFTEKYAEKGQLGFMVTSWLDSKIKTKNAFAVLRASAIGTDAGKTGSLGLADAEKVKGVQLGSKVIANSDG